MASTYIKSVAPCREEGDVKILNLKYGGLPSGLQIERGRITDRTTGRSFRTISFDGGYTDECAEWYDNNAFLLNDMLSFTPRGDNTIANWRFPFKMNDEPETQWYYIVHPFQEIETGGARFHVSNSGMTTTTQDTNYADINNLLYFQVQTSIDDNGLLKYTEIDASRQGIIILEDLDGALYIGWSYLGYVERNNRIKLGTLFCASDLGEFTTLVDFNERFGEESSAEGYPQDDPNAFDGSSDSIEIPDDPSISVSNMGYVNIYKANRNDLAGMLNEIFPDADEIPEPTEANVVEAIEYCAKTIGNLVKASFNSNLKQYILDTHIIPVNPSGGTLEQIQVGYRLLTKNAYRLRNDYVNFDCGTISIPSYYNNFLDLMTQVQVYLPFVGFVPVQPELIIGGKLNISYKFSVIDGSFNAYLKASSKFSQLKNSVIGTYSGCCAVHIPIASADYSSFMSGVVGSIGTLVGKNSTPLGLVKEGENLITSISGGGNYNMSNGYNSTSGFLGGRRPYLLISRPVSSFSGAYPHEMGLPLNVKHRLGDVHGFTVCTAPHLDGINATDSEKAKIYDLLTSGIIL